MNAGSITFSTKLDNAGLEKDLRSLEKKIEKKEREIADLQTKRDKSREKSVFDAAALDAEKAKLREIKDRLSDIRAMSKDKTINPDKREELKTQIPFVQEELAEQREHVRGLQTEWNRLENQIDSYERKLEEAMQALERQKEEAGALRQELDAASRSFPSGDSDKPTKSQSHLTAYLEKSSSLYKKLSGLIGKTSEFSSVLQNMAGSTTGQLSGAFQTAGTAVSGFGKALSSAVSAAAPYIAIAMAIIAVVKKIASAMAEFGKQATQGILNGTKAVVQFSAAVAKNFVSLLKSIGKRVGEFAESINVFSKITDSLSQKLKRLGQMIKRVFVFTVITSGLRALRTQISAYLNVNTEFTTALRRLQGVFLTAFQPIYEVVVPALTTLINVLARAAATVTQFFASLFGTTAKQAQTNAKDLYEQANATTAAGEAAEEASKQLAGFDEINKLEGSKSAGGGGSTSVDTGPLFDYEYEETPFDSWGEAFSAFLDKLLDGIPKLRDKFKDFADWLNDWSKKLYDMFTFPGVLDKVKQLGRDLADALNDLVNWINWEQLGRALGAGLNLALNFLTSFIYEFDWMNLGRKLAEFINGIVYEIDWYEFGRLLWAGFKIGLETLAGFILGLDMPALAEAASNTVMGFFNEMKNTISRINWMEIGVQIATFLTNLDWAGMMSSVADALSYGLNAAISLVGGFVTKLSSGLQLIVTSIVDGITKFLQQTQWKELGVVIGAGIRVALEFVAGLLNPQMFYEIGKAIGDFLIGLDWVNIFDGLTKALANGIKSAVAALKGFLDAVQPNLKEIADGIAQKINEFVENVDWADLGQTISRGIEAALDFMIELMDQIDWDAIGAAICEFLENIDWEALLSKWGTLMGQFIDAKLKMVDLSGAADIGLQIVAGIAKGMWNKFQESGGILGWLKSLLVDPIINGVKNLLGIHSPSTVFAEIGGYLIAGLAQGLSDAWHSIVDFFSEKVDALKTFFSDAWENIKSTASEKWESIKSALSTAWENIKSAAQEKFDAVKEKLSETWENVKEKTKTTWENIKSDLSSKWENIKSTAESAFNTVKEKISIAWANVKTETSAKWEEIKSTLSTAWDKVKTNAQEKFSSIKQSIIDKMGELKDHDWLSIGSSIMNGIWDGLKKVWDTVTGWAKSAADWLGSIFTGAKNAVSSITSSVQTGNSRIAVQSMPDIGNFEIPALARGAVIPPNREFLAVLGDQRSGTNVEAPLSTIEQAVANVMSRMGGSNREMTVIMEIDGREFGRASYKYGTAEQQRVGVRLTEART